MLPSFLLDVVRLTEMDNPVLFRKVCCLLVQNKKIKVEKRIHIRGKPLSISIGFRFLEGNQGHVDAIVMNWYKNSGFTGLFNTKDHVQLHRLYSN